MSSTTLVQQRPGLWLTERQLDAFAVRGAVILGERQALIWDTLSAPQDMEPVPALLGARPFVVAYSHADWDHVWGTAGLPPGAPIVAHAACALRFRRDVPETLAKMRAEEADRWDEVVLISPTMTFSQAMTVDLGGLTVELTHLPGHTPDCLVAFVPEWGVLLAGDTVETPFPVVNDGSTLELWIRELQQWADDARVTTVIPCHGLIGGRELILQNIAYLTDLCEGRSPEVPAQLSPFYAEGHQANLQQMQPFANDSNPVGLKLS